MEERLPEMLHVLDTSRWQGVVGLGGEKTGAGLHARCSSKCLKADGVAVRCWGDGEGERGRLWGR